MFTQIVHLLTKIKNGQAEFGAFPAAFWDPEYADPRLFRELTEFHWSAIMFIPDDFKSSEMAQIVVGQDPTAIQYIPMWLRTHSLCREALARDVNCYPEIPANIVTEDMSRLWIELRIPAFPTDLAALPMHHRTYEMHLYAVQHNPWTISLIPSEHHTSELCRYVENAADDPVLTGLPTELRTYQLCLAMMSKDSLDDVPVVHRDELMCQRAVESNGWNIEFVPEVLATAELWLTAVAQQSSLLPNVPHRFLSPEFYRIAVQSNVDALVEVPILERSTALCEMAINLDPKAIAHTPPGVADEHVMRALLRDGINLRYLSPEQRLNKICMEVILNAAQNRGVALEHVPDDNKTQEMCLAAVSAEGRALKHVPARFRNSEIYAHALADDLALEHVPLQYFPTNDFVMGKVLLNGSNLGLFRPHLRILEVCEAAVMRSASCRGAALKYVRRKLQSREMYVAALTDDGLSLQDVPYSVRCANRDLCLLAIRQNPSAIRFVPKELIDQEMARVALEQMDPDSVLRYIPRVYLPSEHVWLR